MAVSDVLVSETDVETALVRPLTPAESEHIYDLCLQASVRLRAAMPSVDARLATDLSPALVAAVLGDVIARRLLNPELLWSTSSNAGPYGESKTFPGPRSGGGATPGELVITASDLAKLAPVSTFTMPGTIRTGTWCP